MPIRPILLAALLATLTAACSTIDTGSDASSAADSDTVVLVTHESFAVDKGLLAEFERQSGLEVERTAPGDTGTLVNQLVLTKDAPLGDVVFGIDNSFASRALSSGILEPYESPRHPSGSQRFAVDDTDRLTAIDYGDVCVNVDREWFDERGVPEPETLRDLVDPTYEDLLVVTNPATSAPGLAFLLATVDAFGADGWPGYWADLVDNGVKVTDSWVDAYSVDFSGSSGNGPRPIVVSYASSPPAEVSGVDDEAPTRALLDTCFRQVEYAGVLAGAENPEGARQLVDFLLSTRFQESVPSTMFVYPVDRSAELPATWARFAPLADRPFHVSPDEIDENREEWIKEWTDIVVG